MKAILYTKYGSPDVLQVKEVEKPAPKDDEVLIKVYAAELTKADSLHKPPASPVRNEKVPPLPRDIDRSI
jgi:NADPH:quinone reductase-like Zn-dependent oxidoreductase